MANISELSTTAASNNGASPDGAPEGMLAGQVNNVIRELMAALAKWYQDARGSLVTAGTPNAYTLTTNNSHTALSDVPIMAVRVHQVNTGAATLNVDSLGAKSWYRESYGREWGAGELKPNSMHLISYNPTDDCFMDYTPVRAAAPKGHIFGLTMSNDSDADHDILVAVGEATDDDGVELIELTTAITKQIDSGWSVGDDAGGLDTGSVAADTTYHVFLIKRSDTGVVDVLFSTSAASPTMPSNYDLQRRIGSVVTDASANIIGFTQTGDDFVLDTQIVDAEPASAVTWQVVSLSVPTGIRVQPMISGSYEAISSANANDDSYIEVGDGADSSEANPIILVEMEGPVKGTGFMSRLFYTNTSGQIYWEASSQATFNDCFLRTHGWTDYRGQFGAA